MENQIVKVNPNTGLSDKESSLAHIVGYVNLLCSFPISDPNIEIWAITINRLIPDLDPGILQILIDKMIKGEVEWDTRKGIQNIFIGLREVSGIVIKM